MPRRIFEIKGEIYLEKSQYNMQLINMIDITMGTVHFNGKNN